MARIDANWHVDDRAWRETWEPGPYVNDLNELGARVALLTELENDERWIDRYYEVAGRIRESVRTHRSAGPDWHNFTPADWADR